MRFLSFLTLSVMLAILVLTGMPARTTSADEYVCNTPYDPPPPLDLPVILLHGLDIGDIGVAAMQCYKDWFGGTGYAHVVDFPGNDNYENALYIAGAVAAAKLVTGAEKVYLVGHSMGGLSARWYLKYLGGTDHVAAYVSVGTPQHGNAIGCVLPTWAGGQVCWYSLFIASLNAGDETPGSLPYYSFWRNVGDHNDGYIDGSLDDACNFDQIPAIHTEQLGDPTTFEIVYDALANGTCPSI